MQCVVVVTGEGRLDRLNSGLLRRTRLSRLLPAPREKACLVYARSSEGFVAEFLVVRLRLALNLKLSQSNEREPSLSSLQALGTTAP